MVNSGILSVVLFLCIFFTFSCNFLIFGSIELSLFNKPWLLVVTFVFDVSSCFSEPSSSISKSKTQSHKTRASSSCFLWVGYLFLPPHQLLLVWSPIADSLLMSSNLSIGDNFSQNEAANERCKNYPYLPQLNSLM